MLENITRREKLKGTDPPATKQAHPTISEIVRSLVGVVISFRREHVAIMADVETMFHQVKVSDDDSDLLRFLW